MCHFRLAHDLGPKLSGLKERQACAQWTAHSRQKETAASIEFDPISGKRDGLAASMRNRRMLMVIRSFPSDVINSAMTTSIGVTR